MRLPNREESLVGGQAHAHTKISAHFVEPEKQPENMTKKKGPQANIKGTHYDGFKQNMWNRKHKGNCAWVIELLF